MSSNGEAEEKTLTPFVVWAQRKDMILLRVSLHPLEVITEIRIIITRSLHALHFRNLTSMSPNHD